MILRSLVVLLALLLASCVGGGSPNLGPVFMDENASIGTLLNTYRAEHGLSSLRSNAKLEAAAAGHARDLASRNTLSHTGADGSDHIARATRAGYGPFVVENAAAGQTSVAEVMRGFVRSREHRRNLEFEPASDYGFARAAAPGTKYKSFYVLVIGRPPPEGEYAIRRRPRTPGWLAGISDLF